MKPVFIFLTFLTFSYSETSFNGYCVDSWYIGDDRIIYYYRSNTPDRLRIAIESKNNVDEFITNTNKFYYDSDLSACVPIMEDNTSLFMNSLVGILIGFSILFFSIFLTLKVGSRK